MAHEAYFFAAGATQKRTLHSLAVSGNSVITITQNKINNPK